MFTAHALVSVQTFFFPAHSLFVEILLLPVETSNKKSEKKIKFYAGLDCFVLR